MRPGFVPMFRKNRSVPDAPACAGLRGPEEGDDFDGVDGGEARVMERLVGSLKRVAPGSKAFTGEIRNGKTVYLVDALEYPNSLCFRVSKSGRTVREAEMFWHDGTWRVTTQISRVVWKITAQWRGDEIEIEGIPPDELVASGVLPF